jgi:SAM-dependent methyltransferase
MLTAAASLRQSVAETDYRIAQVGVLDGWCAVCKRQTTFTVNTGATFDGRPNLREGLRCRHCKLSNRQRLLLLALQEEFDKNHMEPTGVILESTTRLSKFVHKRWPLIVGSEFLGDGHISGKKYWWATHWWRLRHTRHESITNLSYETNSLNIIAHSDVLEHVYQTRIAFQESYRVLKKGGTTIFTVPFFIDLNDSILRGRQLRDGSLEKLEPDEYHGDGLRAGGVYTFHNFGWSFFEAIRDVGFSDVEVGLNYAPNQGFTSSDPPALHQWSMLPILFRATK